MRSQAYARQCGTAACGSAPQHELWPTAAASTRTIWSSRFRFWIAASLPAIRLCSSACTATNLPQLIARESDGLLQQLSEMTQARHQRFGNTIFHLEPNVKDGPGGLRDCHVSQWIGMIVALASGRKPDLVSIRQNGAARRDARGARVSGFQPLLSALSPWPRRQHHRLGGAGGNGGARHRHWIRTGVGRGMDAALLSPRQGRVSQRLATAQPDFPAALVAAALVSSLALARLQQRIFRGRWARFLPAGRRRT